MKKQLDRWGGVERPYSWAEVKRLQGRTKVKHTLAEDGAVRLWGLMNHPDKYVKALGALSGNQAVQMVKAGLQAIYCSGWQVAADANTSGHTYPDQSLYPVDSVPTLVRRINNALLRAEQIDHLEEKPGPGKYVHWTAPIVADAEAGFGGPLNVYELVKALVEAGASGIHLEDQLASEKKCGHLGGKVLVPTNQFIRSLIAARLACDVLEVPTVIIARTDALSANLITSDVDVAHDWKYIEHGRGRTTEGFYRLGGDAMQRTIDRALAYAPYCDVLWFETSEPNMHEAWLFADRVHMKFPGKLLAYNCSPSFNWKKKLSDVDIARFQDELGKMGYAFQFVTLAGFHAQSHGTFKLAADYNERGMPAYADLQEEEFDLEKKGYTATKHQREVGTGYFDAIAQVISGGKSSTLALAGSTETAQFTEHTPSGEVGSVHGEEKGAIGTAPHASPSDVGAVADGGGAGSPEGPVQHPVAARGEADGEPSSGAV